MASAGESSSLFVTTRHENGTTTQTVTHVDKETGDVTSETSTTKGGKDEGSGSDGGEDAGKSGGGESKGGETEGGETEGGETEGGETAPAGGETTETTGMPDPNEGGGHGGPAEGMMVFTGSPSADQDMGNLTQPGYGVGAMPAVGKASAEDLQQAASLEGRLAPYVTPGEEGFSLSGGEPVAPVDSSGLGVLGQPATQDDPFQGSGSPKGSPGRGTTTGGGDGRR